MKIKRYPREKKRARRAGLSEELRTVLAHLDDAEMSYDTVLRGLSRSSHAVFLILFSFPLCFPVGIPVVTTLLGLLCAIAGLFLLLGKPPWLPRRIREKAVPKEKVSHKMQHLLKVTVALERFLHPRLSWMAENNNAIRVHGFYVMTMGLIAAIPLPLPLGNLVAAFPILLMGLGLAERDGLFILLAYLAGIPCFLYYSAIAVLGWEGIERLLRGL